METALPEEVPDKIQQLLREYYSKEKKNLEDILDFHVKFERSHRKWSRWSLDFI